MLNRCIVVILLFSWPAIADQTSPLAILQENCVSCHSPAKRKGGLAITSQQSLLDGGDSGEAIVPGDSAASYLVETLFPDAESHMPPKGQLSPREISALEDWINGGAKWDDKEWSNLTQPKKVDLRLTAVPDSYRPVLAMALSPDKTQLAASRGKYIDIYELVYSDDNKKPIELARKESLLLHDDAVQSLVYSPDGKTLVSGSFQKLVIGGKEVVKPFSGRLTAMTFSPKGDLLLVADSLPAQQARIHVFSGAGVLKETISAAHDDSIYDLCFSPDGSKFVSVSADKLAIVRDSKSYGIVTTLEGHTSYVLSAAFGPKGKRLATGGDDEVIKIWDVGSGVQISSFRTSKSGPVGGVSWTVDPDFLDKQQKEKDKQKAAAINTDRVIAINDLGQPGSFTELKTHEGSERSTGAKERRHDGVKIALTAMAYDAERLLLFAGSEDGRIFAWDKQGKKIAEVDHQTKLAEVGK